MAVVQICDGESSAAQRAQSTLTAQVRQLFKDISESRVQKDGVTIEWEGPSVIDVDHSQTGDIVVSNHGNMVHSLVAVRFVQHTYERQFEHVKLSVPIIPPLGLTINPDETERIKVAFLCKQPTDFRDVVQVCFKSFNVGVRVDIKFGNGTIRKELEPVSPYERRKRQRRRGQGVHAAETSGSRPGMSDC